MNSYSNESITSPKDANSVGTGENKSDPTDYNSPCISTPEADPVGPGAKEEAIASDISSEAEAGTAEDISFENSPKSGLNTAHDAEAEGAFDIDAIIGGEEALDIVTDTEKSEDKSPISNENSPEGESDEASGKPDEAEKDTIASFEPTRTDATFEEDLRALIAEFPELRSAVRGGISTKRYGELRSLGLSVREAYLAASAPRGQDNRAHIISGVPGGARSPEIGMSSAEMEIARNIFHGLSEQEIKRLYSVVNK